MRTEFPISTAVSFLVVFCITSTSCYVIGRVFSHLTLDCPSGDKSLTTFNFFVFSAGSGIGSVIVTCSSTEIHRTVDNRPTCNKS